MVTLHQLTHEPFSCGTMGQTQHATFSKYTIKKFGKTPFWLLPVPPCCRKYSLFRTGMPSCIHFESHHLHFSLILITCLSLNVPLPLGPPLNWDLPGMHTGPKQTMPWLRKMMSYWFHGLLTSATSFAKPRAFRVMNEASTTDWLFQGILYGCSSGQAVELLLFLNIFFL